MRIQEREIPHEKLLIIAKNVANATKINENFAGKNKKIIERKRKYLRNGASKTSIRTRK